MKRLCILGSSGSIGTSTLDLVSSFPQDFAVTTLAAGRKIDVLERQVRQFGAKCVAVADEPDALELQRRLGRATRVVHGRDGLIEVATHSDVDLVISALVGAVGLPATYAAVKSGRDVALANKETLVVAGEQIMSGAAASGSRILPVDSEHNALHQCLRGENVEEVRRLWLTASGGPFRRHSLEQMRHVTPQQALRHPTWKMGPKITVDSATMMNKGLEVIEARWLFGIGPERIQVVVIQKDLSRGRSQRPKQIQEWNLVPFAKRLQAALRNGGRSIVIQLKSEWKYNDGKLATIRGYLLT